MRWIRSCAALLLAAMIISLCACGGADQKVIGEAAGVEVLYEELRFVTLTAKESLAATYGASIWDTPENAEQYRAELEASVWDSMLNHYAVLAACQKYGLTVADMEDDAIQDAVDAEIEEAIAQYGSKKEFRKALAENYMTESFLRFSLTVTQMENELRYLLIDAGVIEGNTDRFLTWLEDGNAVYVQHILVENDAGEDKEANRALAEELRDKLVSGVETIDSLVGSAYNEDLQNVTPYYVVTDVYDEATETAVMKLDRVGDISRVVETERGFYVFVRMEEDFGDDGSNLSLIAKVDSLLRSYQWAKVESCVQEQKKNLSIALNDYGKSIDLLEIE